MVLVIWSNGASVYSDFSVLVFSACLLLAFVSAPWAITDVRQLITRRPIGRKRSLPVPNPGCGKQWGPDMGGSAFSGSSTVSTMRQWWLGVASDRGVWRVPHGFSSVGFSNDGLEVISLFTITCHGTGHTTASYP